MITRRNFIQKSTLAATGSLLLATPFGCSNHSSLTGTISGANASIGHRLRDGKLSNTPKRIEREDIVIIGGGVSGLSAGRWLKKSGQSFRILELESEAGGNARSGKNKHTSYPLGAHYLPIPALHNTELRAFLEECNVITGYEHGKPIYNDYYLCHAPKERLYINHHWQEGLIPHEGVPVKDREEIQRFLTLMTTYKEALGADGKKAFDLPVEESSRDSTYLALDAISMRQFMTNQGFASPYLQWYVNYCCADDYGSDLTNTSAWAGIHYFASRAGVAANAESDDVLTWPEGNHWLVKQLETNVREHIQANAAVSAIQVNGKQVLVDYLDVNTNEMVRVEAKAAIVCTPQFLNKYILRATRSLDYNAFQYAPWMVANLTVKGTLQERRGEVLCWDNVLYGSKSLGYVHAQHQQLSIPTEEQVITYYLPLTGDDCVAQRKYAQQNTWQGWTQYIFEDLSKAHTSLQQQVTQLEIHLWGHGMIRPQPGFIWGAASANSKKSIDDKIFFAHSDISGISVFEQAFANGIQAATNLMTKV